MSIKTKKIISFTQLKQLVKEGRFEDRISSVEWKFKGDNDAGPGNSNFNCEYLLRHVNSLMFRLATMEQDLNEAILLEQKLRDIIIENEESGNLNTKEATYCQTNLADDVTYDPSNKRFVGFDPDNQDSAVLFVSLYGRPDPLVKLSRDEKTTRLMITIPPYGDDDLLVTVIAWHIALDEIEDDEVDWIRWTKDVEYLFKELESFFEKIEARYFIVKKLVRHEADLEDFLP